jgi:hypothetical protein
MMRVRHAVALLLVITSAASCRQILGIEEATLICPDGLSNCTLCTDADDCGSATRCHSWACIDALCTPVNVPARTPCPTGFCSDTSPSECVRCVEDEDCPGPGGHCGLGECFSCFDGVENGREFGLDCGGPCKGCLGDPCTSPDQCLSGFCADGSCCNTLCDDICAACNLLESSGNCSALPKYSHDWDPPCNGQYVCNDGFCGLRASEICTSNVDCATTRCEDLICVKLPGEACDKPWECFMMSCVNGVCTM